LTSGKLPVASSSLAAGSSTVSAYTSRKPANFITWPVARSPTRPASMSMLV
jgi:hypothetical protein